VGWRGVGRGGGRCVEAPGVACWDARPESALIDADFAGFVLTGPFATLRRAVGASFIGGRSARGARLP